MLTIIKKERRTTVTFKSTDAAGEGCDCEEDDDEEELTNAIVSFFVAYSSTQRKSRPIKTSHERELKRRDILISYHIEHS